MGRLGAHFTNKMSMSTPVNLVHTEVKATKFGDAKISETFAVHSHTAEGNFTSTSIVGTNNQYIVWGQQTKP